MKDGEAPRVRDIARMANVSTATVSRALSRPDLVSAKTRETVLKAVAESGYTMNVAARNLRQQRTGCVLALLPNLSNPFFSNIIGGINSVLRESGLSLLVADTKEADLAQIAALAHRSRADGLIVLDGGIPASAFHGPACPPIVQACEWIEGLDAPRVIADNRGGAELAVNHLLGLGHRRIGQLTGPSANTLTLERSAGVRSALHAAGQDERQDWIFEGDFSAASGQAVARRLAAMPDRPSAMMCHNDEMACGLMGELQRNGISVPDDMSIIGFDNIEMSAHVTPKLTTIRQQRFDLGSTAARLLITLIGGETPSTDLIMPIFLVPRESTTSVDPD